jgi:WD40 repeat protein
MHHLRAAARTSVLAGWIACLGLLLGPPPAAAGPAPESVCRAAGGIAAEIADIEALAFSPDGKFLAAGGADHQVRLYRTGDWKMLRQLAGHIQRIRALVFSPDSRRLVSGACDDSIMIWKVADATLTHTFAGQYLSMMGTPRRATPAEAHRACVTNLAITADGRFLASGSNDRTVRLWDLRVRKPIGRVQHDDYVSSCDFRPRGDLLAFADFRNRTVLFDRLRPSDPLRDLQAPPPATPSGRPGGYGSGNAADDFKTVARFLSNERLITGGPAGALHIWDVTAGTIQTSLTSRHGPVFALARHPNKPLIASGHQSGTILVWDLQTGQQLAAWDRHPKDITSLAFSADGGLIASANYGDPGIQLTRCDWPAAKPRPHAGRSK